jgi:enoyl-CoA hydratase/carnithine racemase
VTLKRPERLNAMTWRMVEEILAASEACAVDDAVRVLAFSGAGRVFSSGDDIVDGARGPRSRGGDPAGTVTATVACTTSWSSCCSKCPSPSSPPSMVAVTVPAGS